MNKLHSLILLGCLISNCNIAQSQTSNYGRECQKNLRMNSNGTITLAAAGLEFQLCHVGGVWNEKQQYCESGQYMTSRDAIARYSTGTWRLITPDEAKRALPYVSECLPLSTWTSVPYIGFTNRGGSISFIRYGVQEITFERDAARDVRLVRAIQSSESSGVSGTTNSNRPNQNNANNENSSNTNNLSPQSSQQNQPTGPKENCEALFTAERRQKLPGPQYAQEYTDCLGRILARSKVQTAAPVVAPTTENCEALFTAERRQKLSGSQYAQEYTDCLGRILARSKAQTAAPKVTPTSENCEALFTAERRQKLSGSQYAQEYTDCLGRVLARSKAQTAAPVVASTTQDAQQQAQQKTHDPAAEAHECVAIDNAGSGNFGAFKNICGYKVNFLTCNYKPRVIQGGFNWSADFDCEQQKFGLHTPDGGRSVAAHNRNTEKVYWFACKAPASPVDLTFVSGQGLSGRCN